MRAGRFVKDRLPVYLIEACSVIMILIFMTAFKCSPQAILVVTVILIVSITLCEIREYFRKKSFYDNVLNSLEELDKKYLLPEILPRPGFYEGEILMDTLESSGKSMAENVAEYRRQAREFREYIELWVHEAKIPIASLRLMLHNARKEEGEDDRLIKKMTGQLERLDEYIENVLYYARSENAEKDHIIKEVSLRKAFGAVAVRNREVLQPLDVHIETSGLDVSVLTDGKWLEFMLGQLLSNSIKYASDERPLSLTVSAEESDGKILLHFKDNGMGISAGDLPYVFEKSFTGRNGRRDARSTGMGLYIVKNLCDKLGHGIEVYSEEGLYTEFVLSFSKQSL